MAALGGPSPAQEGLHAGARGPAGGSPNVILGHPTDTAVTLNLLASDDGEAYAEYGPRSSPSAVQTPTAAVRKHVPAEIRLAGLEPNSRYAYRVAMRRQGAARFEMGAERTFHTQRAPGSAFVFAVQGDSHPERVGVMYDPDLYAQTMRNAAQDLPDFYLTLGDDFSIERLISRSLLSQAAVDGVYAHQRGFLGTVGRSSPLFLVNGNHEQAARYLLDGTEHNAAVLAGRARTQFYSLPAPDGFYTGDTEEVAHIGLLRDYYGWTWGDALFAVIDPYWHSPVPVDNEAGAERRDGAGGKRGRDLWAITLGGAQYRWLTRLLTESTARWKFVFAHHVLGTGRGGVEVAGLYEWGGKDKRGVCAFAERRPGWELPIHQLMAKTGVTVFFQGHDHLYARQELDGVVYQSCPNPADPTYRAFNRDAYRSGHILPNSGHLRVTVSPDAVRVDYVRAFLARNEKEGQHNGMIGSSYTIVPKQVERR